MGPLLWAALGALTVYLVRQKSNVKTGAEDLVLTKPPVPQQLAKLTPARAEVHAHLMQHCIDPKKLKRAATLFGHEGLSQHAEMLLTKAKMIHDMMHGAQAIVERCRTGDQHAMAMAKGIGEQARAGNKRAQISAFLIEEYSKETSKDKEKQAA
jgi:hypothetical protein